MMNNKTFLHKFGDTKGAYCSLLISSNVFIHIQSIIHMTDRAWWTLKGLITQDFQNLNM